MIGLIWAQAANGVIGRDNAIPWHLPEDLAHFRATTAGATVLMGRRTWESLPPRFRPLPGRRNLVLTRDRAWRDGGAEAVHDLDAALGAEGEVWVIGGAQVYAAALPRAERVVVTELSDAYDGETYAPALDASWQASHGSWARAQNGMRYRFVDYRR